MDKKCKVVMLSTNAQSKIYLEDDKSLTGYKYRQRPGLTGKAQHLYVVSNEEIKEGDWFIELDLKGTRSSYCNKPYLCDCGNTGNFILTKNNGNFPFPENCKKIIATTDTSLKISRQNSHPNSVWKLDGALLPSISQSFINEYITKYNKGKIITNVMVEYSDISYKGNLKQLKVNPEDNAITIKRIKDSWTREEVIEFAKQYAKRCQAIMQDSKWIEENL